MFPDATFGDCLGPRGHVAAPGDVGSRVVGAVDVVVLQDSLFVRAIGEGCGGEAVDFGATGGGGGVGEDDAVCELGAVLRDWCWGGEGVAG